MKTAKPKQKRNTSGLVPFTKNDPRINRLGRPRSFNVLRDLVQEVGADATKRGKSTVMLDKVRAMFKRKDASTLALLLAYGWGKPKEEIETTIKGPIPVQVIDMSKAIKPLAPKDDDDE